VELGELEPGLGELHQIALAEERMDALEPGVRGLAGVERRDELVGGALEAVEAVARAEVPAHDVADRVGPRLDALLVEPAIALLAKPRERLERRLPRRPRRRRRPPRGVPLGERP